MTARLLTILPLVAWVGLWLLLLRFAGPDVLGEIVAGAGPWAAPAFVGLKATTFIVAPLNGVPLKVAAGALFGPWEGLAYAVLGDALGGSVNFWLARTFGRRGVRKVAGERAIAKLEALAQPLSSWRGLLVARVVTAAVFDLICYAAGLARVPYHRFLIVTVFGGLIPSAALVTLGAGVSDGLVSQLLMGAAVLVSLAAWRLSVWIWPGNARSERRAPDSPTST